MAHTSTLPTWHRPTSIAQRLTSSLQRAWTAYWARKAEPTTILILGSLDDRTLKDIGMDRSEIESVARNRDRRNGFQADSVRRIPRASMCV